MASYDNVLKGIGAVGQSAVSAINPLESSQYQVANYVIGQLTGNNTATPSYQQTVANLNSMFPSRQGSASANVPSLYTPPPASTPAPPQPTVKDTYDAFLRELAEINRQAMYGTPGPAFDVNAARTSASQRALSSEGVGWYDQLLNDFNQQLDISRKAKQEDYDLQMKNFDRTLEEFMRQADTTEARTKEDVAQNLLDMAMGESLRQDSEARTNDLSRLGLQEALGESGMTYSGRGKQQLYNAQQSRGEREKAQAMQVAGKQREQKTYLTRTIEDLATARKSKTAEVGAGKEAAKLNLTEALADLAITSNERRASIESSRQQAISQAIDADLQRQWEEYYGGLNTGQKVWANREYGAYF